MKALIVCLSKHYNSNLDIVCIQDVLSPTASSSSSFRFQESPSQFHGYKIVSEQSTSRPGCIIELDALKAAQHVSISITHF